MKRARETTATVLVTTMAAGLTVTGHSGKEGGTDAGPAATGQSKGAAGSAGESRDGATKTDDDVFRLTFYYPVNVGDSTV